jgi:hypothetical protein
MVMLAVVELPPALVALTPSVETPATVGVPRIDPAVAFHDNPAGSVPLVIV